MLPDMPPDEAIRTYLGQRKVHLPTLSAFVRQMHTEQRQEFRSAPVFRDLVQSYGRETVEQVRHMHAQPDYAQIQAISEQYIDALAARIREECAVLELPISFGELLRDVDFQRLSKSLQCWQLPVATVQIATDIVAEPALVFVQATERRLQRALDSGDSLALLQHFTNRSVMLILKFPS